MAAPLRALPLVVTVALLVGCSVVDAAAPAATSSPTSPRAPSPTSEAVLPASCTDIVLSPGAPVDGTVLGDCLTGRLVTFGSGREHVQSDMFSGEIQFRYGPDFEFQGTVDTPDGVLTMTLLGGIVWMDRGAGPVRGDVQSEDLEERMVGVTADLYRLYSDPAQHAQLIASSPGWTVGEQETVVLGDGTAVQAYRIASAGGFTWNEVPVSDYTVWVAADWTPVGSEATLEIFGTRDTTRQTYYDLGEPVELVPVA